MGELFIDRRVWLIATRRNVKVMKFDTIFKLRHAMTPIFLATEMLDVGFNKRQARYDRNAVIAFHTVIVAVNISCRFKGLMGEMLVGAFQFLQAKRIGLLFLKELDDLFNAQSDGIDIPAYNFQNGLRFHSFEGSFSGWAPDPQSPNVLFPNDPISR